MVNQSPNKIMVNTSIDKLEEAFENRYRQVDPLIFRTNFN